jgi:hypothetical protein
VEQVASPEIFANCTGKRECMEVATAVESMHAYTIHP